MPRKTAGRRTNERARGVVAMAANQAAEHATADRARDSAGRFVEAQAALIVVARMIVMIAVMPRFGRGGTKHQGKAEGAGERCGRMSHVNLLFDERNNITGRDMNTVCKAAALIVEDERVVVPS